MDKIAKNHKRHSIYKNLIFIYLVSVIPLILLFFISNYLAIDEMYKQKMSTLHSYLETNKDHVENEVLRVYLAQNALMSKDVNIIGLANQYGSINGYTLGKMVSQIHESLYYLKNTSSIIDTVSLYIDDIDRALSSNNYFNDNVSEENKAMYLNTNTDMLKYYEQNIYVTSQIIRQDGTSPYHIYCEIDQDYIINFFSNIEENVYTIFYSKDTILTNGENNITTHIINRLNQNKNATKLSLIDEFQFNSEKYHMVYSYSDNLKGTFVVFAPQSAIIGNLNKYTIFIWLLAILTAIMIFILVISVYHMVKEPFNKLVNMFNSVENGELDTQVNYNKNNELGDLVHTFNFMLNKLKLSIHQIYEKNANLKIAELKQLQAQISPHFLYNSFNLLTHSIEDENITAKSISNSMSEYFKYIAQNDNKSTLKKEMNFANAYLKIQKARFGEKIDIQFDMINNKNSNLSIPRMIIQPLIENSYKHAFSKMVSGGKLKIYYKETKNDLQIVVEDNGPGVSDEKLEMLRASLTSGNNLGHNGICNVHQRLQIAYNEKAKLTIESEKDKYFRNIINIPLD